MNKFFLILLFLFTSNLFADQHQWIDKSTLDKAKKLLENHSSFYSYCPPCTASTLKLIKYINVNVVRQKGLYYSIEIKDEIFDLAYIYLYDEANKEWTNLAYILGLRTENVPKYLSKVIKYDESIDKYITPSNIRAIYSDKYTCRMLEVKDLNKLEITSTNMYNGRINNDLNIFNINIFLDKSIELNVRGTKTIFSIAQNNQDNLIFTKNK